MQWRKIWLRSTHQYRLNLNWDSNESSSEAFAFFQIIFSSLVLIWFRVREGFDGPWSLFRARADLVGNSWAGENHQGYS